MYKDLFPRFEESEFEERYRLHFFKKDIRYTAYVAIFASIAPLYLYILNMPDGGIDAISMLRIILTATFILCGILCFIVKTPISAEIVVAFSSLMIITLICFIQLQNLHLSIELVGVYTCFIFALFIVPPLKLFSQLILSIVFSILQLIVLLKANSIVDNVQVLQIMAGYFGAIGLGYSFRLMFEQSRRKQYVNLQNEITIKDQLAEALKNVKTLEAIIPICASCKKVRNDKGYWNQVEVYITEHTGSQFSHSFCPECTKRIYPNVDMDEEE